MFVPFKPLLHRIEVSTFLIPPNYKRRTTSMPNCKCMTSSMARDCSPLRSKIRVPSFARLFSPLLAVWLAVAVSLCCGVAWAKQPAQTKDCAVVISDPVDGQSVGHDGNVTGTAKIPPGDFLWVFAHHKGIYSWWPQGGGPASISPTGSWTVLVNYGNDRDSGYFDIVAIVVTDSTSRKLLDWFKTAEERHYPPIPLPNAVPDCRIVQVTASKTSE